MDVGISGDRLWVELRFDLPAYLLGKSPRESGEAELESALQDDERLRVALDRMGEAFPKLVTVEVDGRRLPLRLVERPVYADFRPVPRDESGAVRHPLTAMVAFDTRAPAGIAECRVCVDASLGEAVARLRLAPDRMEFVAMGPGEWSAKVPFAGPERALASTALDFLRRGFDHVLPQGWDHALFMFTLLLGAGSLRWALARSLAFTLGHASTLALVWWGWVAAPGGWVEPAIAGSIALSALISLQVGEARSRVLSLGVALIFGLLHGLGFAAAARVPGFDGLGMGAALVGFNLGVECAQLTLLILAWTALTRTQRYPWHESRVRRPLLWTAAVAGLALMVSRL